MYNQKISIKFMELVFGVNVKKKLLLIGYSLLVFFTILYKLRSLTGKKCLQLYFPIS